MSWYQELTEENLEAMAEKCGKPKDELQKMFTEAQTFGTTIVLWREFGTWFAIRVGDEYIMKGYLDDIMDHVARRKHR